MAPDAPPRAIRLEFGLRGARAGAQRADVVVVVDTLSFSTAVAAAVSHGVVVHACRSAAEADELATDPGIERGVRRGEVPGKGRFSLSPLSFAGAPPGTRVALASPNGATCVCEAARGASAVLTAAPVNASAAAAAALRAAERTMCGITVVACGERVVEPDADGPLRFALEDYLGAGAVLSRLAGRLSADAEVCADAWTSCHPRLADLLRNCPSGEELHGWGYGADVAFAAQIDAIHAAALLRDGALGADETLP